MKGIGKRLQHAEIAEEALSSFLALKATRQAQLNIPGNTMLPEAEEAAFT